MPLSVSSLHEAIVHTSRLVSAGQHGPAQAILSRVLAIAPDQADGLHLVGISAGQCGAPERAVTLLERAAAVSPESAVVRGNLAAAYGLLGLAHQAAGRMEEAAAAFRRALLAAPLDVGMWGNLATALNARQRVGEAGEALRRMAALLPDLHTVFADLGQMLLRQSKPRDAVAQHRRATRLRPGWAEGWGALSDALLAAGDTAKAADAARNAVLLNPGKAELWSSLSRAQGACSRTGEAASMARRALRLRGDAADAWIHLAATLHAMDDHVAMQGAARRAAVLAPGLSGPWTALGQSAAAQARIADANQFWRRLCALQPEDVHAHWKLAFTLLLLGEVQEGWREYEWRQRLPQAQPRCFERPRWTGESLRGRTILLHREQGLGDLIQFVRFAAVLKARGARTVVECPRPLLRLLDGVPGVDRWWVEGEEPPDFDCYTPLMSVPGLLGATMADLHGTGPYLTADPERVAHWRQRVDAGGGGLRIGVVWQGSAVGGRSMPLACLAPLATLPGVRLISLQKGDGLEQLAGLPDGMRVETLGEEFDAGSDAFIDTAAAATVLDLVVTVDTSVGHVAGALGRPVWLALTAVPDWRWFLGRDDTPWYPNTRLFRQPSPGDWNAVAVAMAAALANRPGPPA